MADFLQIVKERVVVYDGAVGTNIQKRNPTLDDYWGRENCSEVLVLSGAKQTRRTEGRTVKEYAKASVVDEATGPVFAERSPVVVDAPNIPTPPFWGVGCARITTCARPRCMSAVHFFKKQ